ncbi:hypothetical protein DE146DRAFT_779951 [Phaeosphaeria sp. MPI-PUGE-AT-0046c]|nr:hypothetical protein DE146DRAFT_779951 [Phaeosphaeria sp. MPI-PUGE-AT-0046c]
MIAHLIPKACIFECPFDVNDGSSACSRHMKCMSRPWGKRNLDRRGLGKFIYFFMPWHASRLSEDVRATAATSTSSSFTSILFSITSPLDTTMSSQKNLPILPVLCPAISGVPSRRHIVVVALGEQHHGELLNFIQELIGGVKDVGDGAVTECSLGLVKNKLELIDKAIDELEHHTSAEAKAEISHRLWALKEGREAARRIFNFKE